MEENLLHLLDNGKIYIFKNVTKKLVELKNTRKKNDKKVQ